MERSTHTYKGSAELVEHPVPRGIEALQMLLQPASLRTRNRSATVIARQPSETLRQNPDASHRIKKSVQLRAEGATSRRSHDSRLRLSDKPQTHLTESRRASNYVPRERRAADPRETHLGNSTTDTYNRNKRTSFCHKRSRKWALALLVTHHGGQRQQQQQQPQPSAALRRRGKGLEKPTGRPYMGPSAQFGPSIRRKASIQGVEAIRTETNPKMLKCSM